MIRAEADKEEAARHERTSYIQEDKRAEYRK